MSLPPGIVDVALRVARVLDEMGIRYVLGGSLASGIFGEPRSTRDIDFGVQMRLEQVEEFSARLGPDFDVDEIALREAIRTRSSDNIFFLPRFMKVDLFVAGDEPFDESELQRRQRMSFAEDRSLYVASAEDTVLRKLSWFRLGGEVSDQQWRDVLGILRVSGPALDRRYLTEWAAQLGVSDLLARALAQT